MGIFGRSFPIHPWISKPPPATSAVNVALTGVSATSAAGSFTPEVDVTLAGVAATTAAGTFTPNVQPALIGVSGTGQAGSFTPNIQPSLIGVSGTGQVGTFGVEVDVPLVGVAGTGHAGTFVVEVDVPLTGVSGTGQAGTLSAQVVALVPLVGVSGTGQAGAFSTQISNALSLFGVSGNTQAGNFSVQIFIPIVERDTQGRFIVVDPINSYVTGSRLIQGQSFSLFFNIATDLSAAQNLRLNFTAPSGAIVLSTPGFVYSPSFGLTTSLISLPAFNYVVYSTFTNELNEVGIWKVFLQAGNFASYPGYFEMHFLDEIGEPA